jgi:hypothetical protein
VHAAAIRPAPAEPARPPATAGRQRPESQKSKKKKGKRKRR